MDLTIINECIDYLLTNPTVEWESSETREGVVTLGYPLYDHRVHHLFNHLSDMNFVDYDYLNHYKLIEEKPVDTLSLDECKTYLTFINRGERFSTGHIGAFIKNGKLLLVLSRVKTLLGNDF